jgi:hypothetical protein
MNMRIPSRRITGAALVESRLISGVPIACPKEIRHVAQRF